MFFVYYSYNINMIKEKQCLIRYINYQLDFRRVTCVDDTVEWQ
jgi:hypothetical protein